MTQRGHAGASWVARVAAMVSVAWVALGANPVAAQVPVRSFDQLDTRLKAGDTVWVTDADGLETKGKVASVDASSLVLRGREPRSFAVSDVRLVQLKRHDNLKGGTLVGLVVGLAIGVTGAVAGSCGAECLPAVGLYGAMGAGIGCGVDAMIPENRRDVVYRAGGPGDGSRVAVAPVITRQARGVKVTVAF